MSVLRLKRIRSISGAIVCVLIVSCMYISLVPVTVGLTGESKNIYQCNRLRGRAGGHFLIGEFRGKPFDGEVLKAVAYELTHYGAGWSSVEYMGNARDSEFHKCDDQCRKDIAEQLTDSHGNRFVAKKRNGKHVVRYLGPNGLDDGGNGDDYDSVLEID